MGRDDLATKVTRKLGQPPPRYILSPVTIARKATVRGSLIFVLNHVEADSSNEVDAKIFLYYAMRTIAGNLEDRFKYALEIEDVVSGVTISIPLPSARYMGDQSA